MFYYEKVQVEQVGHSYKYLAKHYSADEGWGHSKEEWPLFDPFVAVPIGYQSAGPQSVMLDGLGDTSHVFVLFHPSHYTNKTANTSNF